MRTKTQTSANRFLLAVLVFLSLAHAVMLTGCRLRNVDSRGTNRPARYSTIAHQALEIESELGVKPNYALLDSVIDEAKSQISAEPPCSREEAVEALKTIHMILQKRNFRFIEGDRLFCEALVPYKERRGIWRRLRDGAGVRIGISGVGGYEKRFAPDGRPRALFEITPKIYFLDCYSATLLYLAIGEALHLPLCACEAPMHCFIRWDLADGSHLNWETTGGGLVGNESFISEYRIPEAAVRSGAYLKSLTPEQALFIVYDRRGYVYAGKGLYDKAIPDFTRAIELNPHSAEPRLNRGTARFSSGQTDAAFADYNTALALDPAMAGAYTGRGNVFCKRREFDRALADHNRALELEPRYALAYLNRGNMHVEKRNYDAAIADYTEAILIDPDYLDAFCNRGAAYVNKGDWENALIDFNRALEVKPDCARAYYNRGYGRLVRGEHTAAIADFTRAVEIDPALAVAYENRAAAWFLLEDFDRAWEDVRRCRELGRTPQTKFIRMLEESSGRRE